MREGANFNSVIIYLVAAELRNHVIVCFTINRSTHIIISVAEAL